MNIDPLYTAYHQAIGSWKGCDWPTRFGPQSLDLKGMTSTQARTIANATSSTESRSWHEAATWLRGVEQAAAKAEGLAKSAVSLAVSGQLLQAFSFARQACELEREYRSEPIWQTLCDTIEAMLEEQGPIADTHCSHIVHGPVMMAWSMNSTSSTPKAGHARSSPKSS